LLNRTYSLPNKPHGNIIPNMNLYVGIAGWYYHDWEGVIYSKSKGFDLLGYAASYFDAVEINNVFYRIPLECHNELRNVNQR
jgi:hypothetical protein